MNVTQCDIDDCRTMVIYQGWKAPEWWQQFFVACPEDPIACLYRDMCPAHEKPKDEWSETYDEAIERGPVDEL